MQQEFDDAVADYTEFLKKCGWPPRIIWVTPKDVLFTRSSRVYIRLVARGRAAEARKEYEAGRASKLGVEVRMLCELDGAACCFVWFPRNREEAARMMMPADGSLKMSALGNHSNFQRSKGIRSGIFWKILSARYGENGAVYGYPFGESSGLAGKEIP